MTTPRCKALTKAGAACRNPVVRESGYCLAHSAREVVDSRGFGGAQPDSGRPARPRVVDVLRDQLEADLQRVLAPLFDGLAAERADGSPDWPARLAAVRELLDRAYGRPTQAQELTGKHGAPLIGEGVFGAAGSAAVPLETRRKIAALIRAGMPADPHERENQ